MSRLKIALRAHVVINVSQIVIELLPVEDVLAFEATDQTGFFDKLHRATKFAVAEDAVAFKLNFDDTNALSFIDDESQRRGSS